MRSHPVHYKGFWAAQGMIPKLVFLWIDLVILEIRGDSCSPLLCSFVSFPALRDR